MQLGFCADGRAFQNFFDQIYPPARAIEFVAQQLISGASRGAKPAVHAFAQDLIGGSTVGRVFDKIRELGLHRLDSKLGVHAMRV